MKPAMSVSAEMPLGLLNLTKTGSSRARNLSRWEIAIRRRPMPICSGFRRAPWLTAMKVAVSHVPTSHGNRMEHFRLRATDRDCALRSSARRPERPSSVCKHWPYEGKFRSGPSVGTFRFGPAPRVLDEIKDTADSAITDSGDRFAIKHQFFGHGRHDRRWGCNEDDTAACDDGQSWTRSDHFRLPSGRLPFGNTLVHANRIKDEIDDGSSEVVNPSESADPNALRWAIVRTRLQKADFSEDSPGARLALDGRSFAIGDRSVVWTARHDMGTADSHSCLRFRSNGGMAHEKTRVLGSEGVSSAWKRPTDMMLNPPRSGSARLALPTGKLPATLQTGKNP